MAIDILTVVLTAVCTGIGISIGNGLYEIYFKDSLKKLKKQNERLKNLHRKLGDYKRPWLAALLNIFLWGTGYFYIKKRRFLGTILFLVEVFVLGGYIIAAGSITGVFEGISYSFMTVIISMLLGIDAYRLARNVNAKKEE